jgi:hypothetical protein
MKQAILFFFVTNRFLKAENLNFQFNGLKICLRPRYKFPPFKFSYWQNLCIDLESSYKKFTHVRMNLKKIDHEKE